MTAADVQTLPALSMADLPLSIGAAKALLCLSGYAGIRCWHPQVGSCQRLPVGRWQLVNSLHC